MKTVQVVLDERTLKAADREAKRENINRSMLVRRAIALYVARARERELEERQRRGYEKKPVKPGEFDAWDKVRSWPEESALSWAHGGGLPSAGVRARLRARWGGGMNTAARKPALTSPFLPAGPRAPAAQG